ncbi:kinesin-like protein KIF21A-like [Mucor ambiguus]|uniref:Kinesin-like protein KIF21A-like n=1 Tax=Mucor ambiguus TaxID=91626 RepID=A0A0C9LWA1_9FUNG|nr:kinesin-like protein KIF21A-like [Mucor ambiguus]
MTSTAVRVALRVRPLTQKEQLSNCTECISFIPNQPQILIGKDHSFTYDYVFDTNSIQQSIYETSVVPLAEKFVDGFNATILAYGQTGSGKTFSMGTALDEHTDSDQQGVVPRFIYDLYNRLHDKKQAHKLQEFQVFVSFLELYNEDFVDLLNAYSQQSHNNNSNRKRSNSVSHFAPPPCEVQIREDVHGQIYWSGVREELCSTPDELLRYLTKGSLCRTTGSTDMNSVSSRSHAIFSVILKQKVPATVDDDQVGSNQEQQQQKQDQADNTIVSKFHFVDLAGSERLKRTKAEGNRAREGISINSGLLALGNVISALGDESRKSVHIPYRDSKLTRLLQDSLGGNSQTLMMACVSPSDSNFLETLSTLKYANRARNIKNKVTINQEFAGSSVEVNQLRSQVARLKLELNALRGANSSHAGGSGNSAMKSTTTYSSSDMMINNMLNGSSTAAAKVLKEEIDRLKARVRQMSDDICRITTERDSLQMERELAQHMNSEDWPNLMEQLQQRRSSSASLTDQNTPLSSLPIIAQYQKAIQDLRNELTDTQERLAFSESIRAPLMHAMAIPPSASVTPQTSFRTHQQQYSSTTTFNNNNKRRGIGKKRRTHNGSSTTTSRNVTFRSTRRSKVPNMPAAVGVNKESKLSAAPSTEDIQNSNLDSHDDDEQDIQEWLKATMGSIQTSESSGLRLDAKNSISNARSQIDKALKVLDEFKIKEPEPDAGDQVEYDCDLLNDDELFIKLQSDDIQSLFGELEEEIKAASPSQEDETPSNAPRFRMASTETLMTDDNDLAEFYEKNPQMHRMLSQIQSDIQVNEDLVLQLEKTEVEYSQMRKKFEKKLYSLRDEILTLRQQQQQQQKKETPTTVVPSTTAAAYSMNSIRHAYEAKMKTLMSQLSELRRKYSQTSSTMQSSRNQNESMLRALRVNVESLKVEKRRMIKRMKDEAERVKEKLHNREREIQQLRRKQMKDNEVKKRLEREVKQMQLVIGKKTDESVVTAEKLKSLVKILKKAVREGGVLDEKLLASCGSLLDIGSALVQSSRVGRMSRNRRSNSNSRNARRRLQQQSVPAEVRAAKKKTLLDNALYQLIQGKQAVEEMKQLLSKRNDLSQRKIEYLSERELLVLDQDTKDLSSIDNAFRQVIDENIETVEAEISYINARIHAIHNDAAAEIMQEDENDEEIIDMSQKQKRVTFVETQVQEEEEEEDNWHDMDALEERYSLPASAGPEQSLEMISKIFRSLADDEARYVMESIIDDMVLLRMEEHNNKMSIQQLEKSTQDLRRTLIVMKKAAIDTTIENEKKLKRLTMQQQGGSSSSVYSTLGGGGSRRTSMSREYSSSKMSCRSSPTNEDSSDADSAIDLHNEDQYQHVEIMFEKIYTDGLNGKVPTYDYGVAMAEATAPVIMAENELSPYLRPHPVTNTNGTGGNGLKSGKSTVQAPMKPSTSPLVSRRRDSMSSPEQFLLQFLQTPKDVRPPSSPLMKPAEFTRYQHERESSTNSSVRNRSLPPSIPRRSSLQSDNGSWCSIYSSNHGYSQQMIRASSGGSGTSRLSGSVAPNEPQPLQQQQPQPPQPPTTILNRRRAFSFQQPPSPTPNSGPHPMRRRSLLRELTNPEIDQIANKDYSHNGTALIPTFSSNSNQNQQQQHNSTARPHSVLALHAAAAASTPRPSSKASTIYPNVRRESPNNSYELRKSAAANNVFDRLSSGHTHASQAKKRLGNYHRYSSSSIDDLRMQWANELAERNEEQ